MPNRIRALDEDVGGDGRPPEDTQKKKNHAYDLHHVEKGPKVLYIMAHCARHRAHVIALFAPLVKQIKAQGERKRGGGGEVEVGGGVLVTQ